MLVIGSLIGIVIIAALLLKSLGTGLRSIAEIEAVTQLPSLAIVPRTKSSSVEQNERHTTAQRNIAVLTSPKSQFAE
jgi:succinoglycan biosynthesis transport protein ExoP